MRLTTSHCKNKGVQKRHTGSRNWTDNLERPCKPTGKRPLGRPRRRWEDNIRMDLEEIGINSGTWVDSAHDRNCRRALVNAALNLRVP